MSFEFTFLNYEGICEVDAGKCMEELQTDLLNIRSNHSDIGCLHSDHTCTVTYTFYDCEVSSSGSFTLKMLQDESYATDIYLTISSSSSIPGEKSTLKTAISTSDRHKYFRGSDPSTVFILMTPSLLLTDSDEWDTKSKGYHVSQTRDPTPGSMIEYSE
jgi:hypothetical protein